MALLDLSLVCVLWDSVKVKLMMGNQLVFQVKTNYARFLIHQESKFLFSIFSTASTQTGPQFYAIPEGSKLGCDLISQTYNIPKAVFLQQNKVLINHFNIHPNIEAWTKLVIYMFTRASIVITDI